MTMEVYRAPLTTEQGLEQVKEQIHELVAPGPLPVKTKADQEQAKQAVIEIRGQQKKHKAWFEQHILAHSKKAYQESKASYDAQKLVLTNLLAPIAEWDKATSANILAFEQSERIRLRKIQEAEQKKYEKRVEKAEAKGQDLETVKPPLYVAPSAKTTKTEGGAFTIKERKVLVITDEAQIPDSYYDRIMNTKRIEADLRSGVTVPGAMLRVELGEAIRNP